MASASIYPFAQAFVGAVFNIVSTIAVPALNASLASSYEVQGVPNESQVQFGVDRVRLADELVVNDSVIDVYLGQFRNEIEAARQYTFTVWAHICLKMLSAGESVPEDFELVKQAFVGAMYDALTAGDAAYNLNPNLSTSNKPLPGGVNFTDCYPEGGNFIPPRKLLNGVSIQRGYCISTRGSISVPFDRPYALGGATPDELVIRDPSANP